MDDALMVTNLVYFGTLMIGGVLLVFLAVATVITLVVAGVGQAVASILMALVRAIRGTVLEAPEVTAEAARTEYTRKAVVAKADAILASQRAAATAAAEAAATARDPRGPESEDALPVDDEVAVPVALVPAATAPGTAEPTTVSAETIPAAPTQPADAAVVARLRPARPAPSRPGPRTGTQPVLVTSRAS